MLQLALIRVRLIRLIIKALKLNTVSGPDGLLVRVFRKCCDELAFAIAVVMRFLIRIGFWLQPCKFHCIQPLYNKATVFSQYNYRNVHLTNIIDKIVERALAIMLGPHFYKTNAFGYNPCAFDKCVLKYGFKVVIYLSNIFVAYDRVDHELLANCFKKFGYRNKWFGCCICTYRHVKHLLLFKIMLHQMLRSKMKYSK